MNNYRIVENVVSDGYGHNTNKYYTIEKKAKFLSIFRPSKGVWYQPRLLHIINGEAVHEYIELNSIRDAKKYIKQCLDNTFKEKHKDYTISKGACLDSGHCSVVYFYYKDGWGCDGEVAMSNDLEYLRYI